MVRIFFFYEHFLTFRLSLDEGPRSPPGVGGGRGNRKKLRNEGKEETPSGRKLYIVKCVETLI